MNIREQELACRHFMVGVRGIGGVTARKLLDYYGNALRIWELSDKEIMKDKIMTPRQKSALLEVRKRWDLEKEWERLKTKKISMVTYGDPDYPARLKTMEDKPFVLYYKGKLPGDNVPSVAVIGSRMCTGYGRSIAEYYGAELAQRGIQIISGMASGIDGIAQKSALERGGSSYGILGCGVDICYPPSNRALYEMLIDRGGLLSEFLPGEAPEAGHFPMRNRLISGLADLVLVVESREKSGTRITVNLALEQGKEVYAVPGRVQDELSAGCNLLIREGAGIALDVNEITSVAEEVCLRHCNIDADESVISKVTEMPRKSPEPGETQAESDFSGIEYNDMEYKRYDRILYFLKENAMGADEIFTRLKACDNVSEEISFPKLQEMIADLVLQGKIINRMGIYELV